jgi:integrative and conjugative element protein (TIGR02256 family)
LFFFNRSRKRAQEIVNKQWKKSSGISIYLGEWHTHPVPDPVPSSRDRQMIRNMFNQTQMEITFLFLIIIGTRSNWVGVEDGKTLRHLKCVSVVGQQSQEITTEEAQCLTAAQVESNQ